MKLFRFGIKGQERLGICIDNQHYDLSDLQIDLINDQLSSENLARIQEYVNEQDLKLIDASFRFGTPIANPRKIICVGLNYEDHITETGFQEANEPILFLKAISALNGPNDDIIIPKDSLQTDWETELGIVIGKEGTNIDEKDALSYIAGYVLLNDVSERDFMKNRGGTWDKGKGCNTFAPVGPYLVTPDEIEDINNLKIWLKLNGELMQNGNTKDLIFKIPKLISYISTFFGLFPGDIIATGSPAGSGTGKKPQIFLRPGDVIEYGIDHLGSAQNKFITYNAI